MDTLKDFITFLRNWRRVKKAPVLSVGRSTRLLRKRNPRRPLPIPPYQRGEMGGCLVPFKVEEPKRFREWIVWIEMFPPTLLRPYWLPVETELTLVQVAAMTKMSPSRIYGRLRTHPMRSAQKRGSKWVFLRDEFLRYDLPELDPDCEREPRPDGGAEATPGFRMRRNDEQLPTWPERNEGRAGRHVPGCHRRHRGICPVPPRAKKPRQPLDRAPRRGLRWTTNPRTKTPRPSHGSAADRRETPRQDEYRECLPDRPTATEMRLWRLAGGDPSKYTDLAIEYSDEIAADRAAGRFAPKTPTKR